MHVHFLRHATLVISIAGKHLLVDPMLSPAQAMDPVSNAPNPVRIPMVELPMSESELRQLIASLDGVLVTHHHRDHWDARAVDLLPKSLPIFTQPASEQAIRAGGFTNVKIITDWFDWDGLQIFRTGGQHGTGEIRQAMGEVSGFVLKAASDQPSESSLYIAGDTIWCADMETALSRYQPEVVIVNAGAAQFLTGDPITMTAEDVLHVVNVAPNAQLIAVHMETVNHCLLTRMMLQEALVKAGIADSVTIPTNGTQLTFKSVQQVTG